jgi:putative transposase
VNPPVGIDVGLEHFFTMNEGEHVANPGFLKEQLPELRRCQRSVLRKKKGSKKRRKAVVKVSKLHTRVRNVRREYHYQVVNRLIDRYGLFAVERRNIRGMLRNHRLAKAISDVGWYHFRRILAHKAESAGAVVVEVNPAGTSQFCSDCGAEVRKSLSDRWHSCDCGYSVYRDVKAARNILLRALAWIGLAGPKADVSSLQHSDRSADAFRQIRITPVERRQRSKSPLASSCFPSHWLGDSQQSSQRPARVLGHRRILVATKFFEKG